LRIRKMSENVQYRTGTALLGDPNRLEDVTPTAQ
jgi:hypothetical protein